MQRKLFLVPYYKEGKGNFDYYIKIYIKIKYLITIIGKDSLTKSEN